MSDDDFRELSDAVVILHERLVGMVCLLADASVEVPSISLLDLTRAALDSVGMIDRALLRIRHDALEDEGGR